MTLPELESAGTDEAGGKAGGLSRRLIAENWRGILSYVTVLAIVGGFILLLAFFGVIELDFIFLKWPTAYGPLQTSLTLTVAAFAIGFVGALPLGVVRAYGLAILRRRRGKAGAHAPSNLGRKLLTAPAYGLASGYVGAIRGTPFLVQVFLMLYLFLFLAPKLNFLGGDVFFWAGLVALTLNTLGYQAEVLRAGFQSIAQGQIDSAKAIGLRGFQTFRYITFPQALRLIVLPLTNEFISLFKASTIVSYIAVYELFHWSEDMGQKFGHPIEGFLMVSLFYLLVNVPLSRIVSYLERKKRIPGLGTPIREGRGPRAAFPRSVPGQPGALSARRRTEKPGAALQRFAEMPSRTRRRLVPVRHD